MADRRKLVMATNNAGKLREARAIAGDRLEILSLADIGYHHDIPETADTLDGNALIKVRTIKEATGYDCFADDTGLMVDALGGAPGVYTARYAGEGSTHDNNIELMLKNMEGVSDRSARFRTSVALTLNGEEHIFHGEALGRIATERSGSHGFGYDPIFISSETGKCFAEMNDEDKNAISHRGRAITAMMKWLSTLCVCIFLAFSAKATQANASGWKLHNTFDNKIEHVFDTPEKTYFIVQAHDYQPSMTDNNELLSFLFCLEKGSGEIRPYNALNFLSGSLIRQANYNASKGYLILVYDDYTIDILDDDGTVHTILGLKNYSTSSTKNVRSITFDNEKDRAYLSTDFGVIALNDKKHEVATSYIYGIPVDYAVRVADKFLILADGTILTDDADSRHFSLSDFTPAEWAGNEPATRIYPLSETRMIFSKTVDGKEQSFVATFTEGNPTPGITPIGTLEGVKAAENKSGLFFPLHARLVQIDRNTGATTTIAKRSEDYALPAGSWDLKDIYYAQPREGFYSLRLNSDNSFTVTSQTARPNAPAAFRSDALLYSSRHGLLVNSHGINQNFSSNHAPNPILLSGLKDGEWTMYGLPYLDATQTLRLINPCGFAQDPDDPDVFYFGSMLNGLIRYNVKDMSNLLHITRSDDSPSLPGHVSVQQPYADWGNAFMVENPRFDSKGNLIVAHNNTNVRGDYKPEIWIWTAEDRRASTSPESFRPFTRLKVDGVESACPALLALPLSGASTRNMIVYISLNLYRQPFVVYDHNGTPTDTSDDRQGLMKNLKDSDGEVSYNYIYCATEDPATGLVWVGTDNGLFTFNPADAFTDAGKVSRIKVSRNDGTSLADYLLAGSAINNISIDGLGRKWFSLSGGGLVCTSADGRSILHEINTGNSPLPSDNVYATVYNPDSNSLAIATSAGVCEYFLNGQAAEGGKSSVRAYPNPVRHDYYGLVTIDGLEEGAIVKIADSAGNIVRELGPASGGSVKWDACGMDMNRVPSGVYFVLASSGTGDGSFNESTKILVINR